MGRGGDVRGLHRPRLQRGAEGERLVGQRTHWSHVEPLQGCGGGKRRGNERVRRGASGVGGGSGSMWAGGCWSGGPFARQVHSKEHERGEHEGVGAGSQLAGRGRKEPRMPRHRQMRRARGWAGERSGGLGSPAVPIPCCAQRRRRRAAARTRRPERRRRRPGSCWVGLGWDRRPFWSALGMPSRRA